MLIIVSELLYAYIHAVMQTNIFVLCLLAYVLVLWTDLRFAQTIYGLHNPLEICGLRN